MRIPWSVGVSTVCTLEGLALLLISVPSHDMQGKEIKREKASLVSWSSLFLSRQKGRFMKTLL